MPPPAIVRRPWDSEERQPDVFEGTISADGSRFEGTWSAAYYEADEEGVIHVYDEWTEIPFYAEQR